MLWAPAGLGKSMLALTLALAVAGGGRVLGWTSPRPRAVLYVDGEMHGADLRDRLKMLAATVEGFDSEAAARNLTIICRQMHPADIKFPDLTQRDDQDVVLAQAAKVNAELVILDNFSTLTDGLEDENEAAAMSPVLGFLLRMKQAGRACILVHHSDKTGGNYRGSSKLAATFEIIIGLHRLDGRAITDGTGFELRWGKFRGKPSVATRDTEITLENTEGDAKWVYKVASSAEVLAVVDAVRSCQFATQDAIAKHLGMDKSRVTRLKGQAFAGGVIRRDEWDECLGIAREAEDSRPEF